MPAQERLKTIFGGEVTRRFLSTELKQHFEPDEAAAMAVGVAGGLFIGSVAVVTAISYGRRLGKVLPLPAEILDLTEV